MARLSQTTWIQAQSCPTANFTVLPVVPVRAPGAIALRDINLDGIPDLIGASVDFDGVGFSGALAFLLGNGDGTFQSPRFEWTSRNPWSIALGDFNRDGKLDVAVANAGQIKGEQGDVTVFLGNGDGFFEPAVHYASRAYPYSIAVDDLNGDGKEDLAVANNYEGAAAAVSIFLGRGDGSFQDARLFASGVVLPDSASIAIGDFNNYGHPDLVVSNVGRTLDDSSISLLLGEGNGNFSAPKNYFTSKRPIAVVVGDFDRNGTKDVAVANLSSDLSIYLGDGAGGLTLSNSYPVQFAPYSLAAGDLNLDGFTDLAAANQADSVSVFFGKGDGGFQSEQRLVAGHLLNSLALADINNDGAVDIAVTDRDGGGVVVLRNNCLPLLPGLRATPGPGGLILSWPSRFNDFGLETTSFLSAPAWTLLPDKPALTNGWLQLLAPVTSDHQFFRLHSKTSHPALSR